MDKYKDYKKTWDHYDFDDKYAKGPIMIEDVLLSKNYEQADNSLKDLEETIRRISMVEAELVELKQRINIIIKECCKSGVHCEMVSSVAGGEDWCKYCRKFW